MLAAGNFLATVLFIISWSHGVPNPRLAALAPNTLLDLDSLKLLSPVGESQYFANGVVDYGGMTYDPNDHQMLMWGGGHATTMTDAVYSFSFQTLKWSALYTPTPLSQITTGNLNSALASLTNGPSGPYPRPLSRHSYDLLVVPEGRRELLMLREVGGPIGSFYPTGKAAHYDFAASTWLFASGFSVGDDHYAAEYDPVSAKVILLKGGGLWVYDPAAKIGFKALGSGPTGNLGYADHLVYFPPNQKMYYFKRGSGVWEVALNRGDFTQTILTQLSTSGPMSPHGEPGYDYDSANKIIGGGVYSNTFYAFNPVTRSWTSKAMQGGSPGTQNFHAIAYDPVDNVFVFIADQNSGWWLRKTWAYRYAGGTPSAIRQDRAAALADDVRVYPNPIRPHSTLNFQFSGPGRVLGTEIFSLAGKRVTGERNLAEGIYLLRIHLEGRELNRKFVVQ